MQTFLHGRDLIGDLDFSKEEVETVMDVAFDLKRKRALGRTYSISTGQSPCYVILLQQHTHTRIF